MLQHLFAVMNELLDELLIRYSEADETQRETMREQMSMLQSMSDSIVDGWLQVEEKLAALREQASGSSSTMAAYGDHASAAAEEQACAASYKAAAFAGYSTVPGTPGAKPVPADETVSATSSSVSAGIAAAGAPSEEARRDMAAGQGYFDLTMYKEAAAAFDRTIRLCPESITARIYLAMSYMHLQDWDEAQQHFQFAVKLTGHPKLKALGLNALGCIQAIKANMDQAECYFRQAYEADPTFLGAARNLTNCKANAGTISLYFGSAELSCM